jgi:hypothetical protein
MSSENTDQISAENMTKITTEKNTQDVEEDIDFTDMDIEAEYEKIKHGWCSEGKTLEDKKKSIRRNILECKSIRKEIRDYMQTEEYKTAYAQLNGELEEQGKAMDPEVIFRMRRGQYATVIEYTDEEKIALGIKGMCKEARRQEMVEKYIPRGEFIEGTDYTFFSIENGSFASRNILVPTKEFNEVHQKELEMLRRNAEMSVKRDDGVTVHTLFQVLDGKDLDERGCGCMPRKPTEFDQFLSGMMSYAECDCHFGVYYGYLSDKKCDMDEERKWYIKSICNGYGYFNPETGATTLTAEAKQHKCTVSESFMFMERYINHPHMTRMSYDYETPEELRQAIIDGKL